MSHTLARFHRTLERIDDERKITRILADSIEEAPATVTHATLPGDKRRLRGIPVAGGACGTSPGTDPLHELLRNDRSDRYPPKCA